MMMLRPILMPARGGKGKGGDRGHGTWRSGDGQAAALARLRWLGEQAQGMAPCHAPRSSPRSKSSRPRTWAVGGLGLTRTRSASSRKAPLGTGRGQRRRGGTRFRGRCCRSGDVRVAGGRTDLDGRFVPLVMAEGRAAAAGADPAQARAVMSTSEAMIAAQVLRACRHRDECPQGQAGQGYPPIAPKDVRRIGALFGIERSITGQPPDVRLDVRKQLSAPLVKDLGR